MFQWLNSCDVESDEGFAFKCAHRFYYHYVEEDRVLKIFVEPVKNGLEVFFESCPKWEAPYKGELLSEGKALEIEIRVRDALDFMSIKHSIRKE